MHDRPSIGTVIAPHDPSPIVTVGRVRLQNQWRNRHKGMGYEVTSTLRTGFKVAPERTKTLDWSTTLFGWLRSYLP